HLLPPTAAEIRLIGNTSHLDGKRLACQCRLFGPVTIDVSDHLATEKEALKKIKGINENQLSGESRAVVRTLILDAQDDGEKGDHSAS
ncbi:MAG: hypothetical protein NZ480_00895, partial [Bdellovibrionaceae bacterium]|nr:hypothetical protein [Pseudobdellovibrionaceae bacterium]